TLRPRPGEGLGPGRLLLPGDRRDPGRQDVRLRLPDQAAWNHREPPDRRMGKPGVRQSGSRACRGGWVMLGAVLDSKGDENMAKMRSVKYYRCWPGNQGDRGEWDTDYIEIPSDTPDDKIEDAIREAALKID